MGLTGAISAFLGSLFTRYMPIPILLIGISMIVLYEAYILIRSSKKARTEQTQNPEEHDEEDGMDRVIYRICNWISGWFGRFGSRKYSATYYDISL